MHNLVSSCIVHLENTCLLNYAGLPNVGSFHYSIKKSLVLLLRKLIQERLCQGECLVFILKCPAAQFSLLPHLTLRVLLGEKRVCQLAQSHLVILIGNQPECKECTLLLCDFGIRGAGVGFPGFPVTGKVCFIQGFSVKKSILKCCPPKPLSVIKVFLC